MDEIGVVLVVLVVALIIFFPTIADAPARRRRRRGITIWDEELARGNITYEQWLKTKEEP
jgi:uncharacterized membrane protein